jgi:adenine phosphoribosyltransferase
MLFMDTLKKRIRHVPDFPKPGILFYDITTLLRDPEGFQEAVGALATPFVGDNIDLVVGVESRGFILGAAVADRLKAGFVPVRKVGKLPSTTVRVTYDLEYGSDSLEIHNDAIAPGNRVLIVDDLLATGGTARATVDLVKQLGGTVHGAAFLIELAELSGRTKLQGENLFAVLTY